MKILIFLLFVSCTKPSLEIVCQEIKKFCEVNRQGERVCIKKTECKNY